MIAVNLECSDGRKHNNIKIKKFISHFLNCYLLYLLFMAFFT